MGVWVRGASKKIVDPHLFLQSLKVATWVWVLAYQERTFRTKTGEARGAPQKYLDPLVKVCFGKLLPKPKLYNKLELIRFYGY